MHAGALGLSTGLEFNPGRMAPTDELVRLNKVVGEYGGYYTSHIRNRDSQLQESIEEFLTIVREGGTHGEISHLNVRNRTGAAPGAWQRAVDTMQTAREVEGLDVLADTTPFQDGLGQMAGILPQWVMDGGWEKACARLRDPRACASGCATSATATGASSTAASGTACGCRRARSTRSSRARTSTRSRALHRARTSGMRTSTSSPRPGPALESILLIGELFTDEHLTEMISHPLFSLGVDGYTSALDAGLDGGRRRTRSASPGTSTT